MRKIIPLIMLILYSLTACAETNTVVCENAGFSIKMLDKPVSCASSPFMMSLPSVNGFAPNVNVQIQPYSGSIDDYKKLSTGQFSLMGLEVISISSSGNELYFEYAGSLAGMNLHFYAKAIKNGDYVYLATATDTKTGWPQSFEKLKSVVDSFVTN